MRTFLVGMLVLAALACAAIVGIYFLANAGPAQHTTTTPPGSPAQSESAPPQLDRSRIATSPDGRVGDDNFPLGFPVSQRQLQIVRKQHYTLGYDNERREPAWCGYHLSGPIRYHGAEHRPQKFAAEPSVRQTAYHEDYSRSGYDRGHLCPAFAEFSRFGPDAMAETFTTANIIPQVHKLNAGAWEHLEELLAGRDGHGDGWAAQFDVWVTDGPEYTSEGGVIPGGEPIPSACWMIVERKKLDRDGTDALAFEFPNAEATAPLPSYLVSIRSIEQRTRINFDPLLTQEAANELELKAAEAVWP